MKTFGCRFAQAYGLTETTGAIVTLPPEDHDPDGPNRHRLRAAGKPNGNVELRIVDPDSMADVPVGEVGEVIAVRPVRVEGVGEVVKPTLDGIMTKLDAWAEQPA